MRSRTPADSPSARRRAHSLIPALGIALMLVLQACSSDDDAEPAAEPVTPMEVGWTTQIGSDASDTTFGVDVLSDGDAVVVASTQGSIAEDHQGGRDVFVTRLDGMGEAVWSTQLGADGNDSPLGVSVSPSDEIYVAGFTESNLVGPNAGSADAWIAEFDEDGEIAWQDQFGGDDWDRVFDVSAFDGGAYISGYTLGQADEDPAPGGGDGFVARYDSEGNREWTIQFGTAETDWAQGSALAPDGGLYVTGYTTGDLGGPNAGQRDAFLTHVDPTGAISWTAQIGTTEDDWTQGVGTDEAGNAYIAGFTAGALGDESFGGTDGLLAAFTPEGEQIFVSQIGSPGTDKLFEVRVDGDTVYATGASDGETADTESSDDSGRDGFLRRFDLSGTQVDLLRLGTAEDDDLTGLAVAGDGTVVASGYTSGVLDGTNAGSSDLFVVRLTG